MKKTIELDQNDFNHLHDVILEATDKSLTNEEMTMFYMVMPQHLREQAEHYGLSDTVVRDNIYEWILSVKNKKEQHNGKP